MSTRNSAFCVKRLRPAAGDSELTSGLKPGAGSARHPCHPGRSPHRLSGRKLRPVRISGICWLRQYCRRGSPKGATIERQREGWSWSLRSSHIAGNRRSRAAYTPFSRLRRPQAGAGARRTDHATARCLGRPVQQYQLPGLAIVLACGQHWWTTRPQNVPPPRTRVVYVIRFGRPLYKPISISTVKGNATTDSKIQAAKKFLLYKPSHATACDGQEGRSAWSDVYAGLPTTKPRDSALRAVTKEVVGIHILLTRSLFGDDILRRLLLRVSLAKPPSAPLRFWRLRKRSLNLGLIGTKSREKDSPKPVQSGRNGVLLISFGKWFRLVYRIESFGCTLR